MKRSEMVNLMLKVERDCQEYKCSRAFMNTLLRAMEDAGMKAPERDGNDCSYSCEGIYEWEAEE